jgi:tetratricopeptide (TPR) repeat protein
MSKGLKLAVAAVVLGTFLVGFGCMGSVQNKQQEQETVDANRLSGQELDAAITKYKTLLDECAGKKSDRCANVMYTLGSLYCKQATEQRGTRPVPDYSKSLAIYWQLSRTYPDFPKLPKAYYQMSQSYIEVGHIDTARIILEQLCRRFPESHLVPKALLRLDELASQDEAQRTTTGSSGYSGGSGEDGDGGENEE